MGFSGPLAGLADDGSQSDMGHHLFGVDKGVVLAQYGQEPRGRGLANTRYGVEEVASAFQVWMSINVLVNLIAGGLDFLLQGGEPGLDRLDDGRISGLQAILFHPLPLQKMFDPAHEGL